SFKGERILLVDPIGNPADEVRYYDGGRWPEFADGGGSSLELRNPQTDNSKGESWAASDESGKSSWQTVTYRGLASNPVGPTQYNELVVGLLDAGIVLLDDVRVIEDPDGAARPLIQNGDFESDTVGEAADKWRALGTHGTSRVIPDPDDPGNQVLQLVATGHTGHMHNHAETTLKFGNSYVTIKSNLEYEISFRARWVTGSSQLNTRLYFSRLQRTTLVEVPEFTGTPGAQNSTFVANVGPTYADLRHAPVVPQPGEAVTVSVKAEDPQDVAEMTLHYAVGGGAPASLPMTSTDGIEFTATIPGQVAATIVQFYVEGRDTLGQTSTFPAGGPDSRALLKVDDAQQSSLDVHHFRIIMTTADANLLHTATNVMSNARLGATVVYDESEVFYDVGVRLKGSERGRNRNVRVGFNVQFDPAQRFLGVHDTVGVDRSGAGDQYSQKEILVKHTINRAGDVPSMYDDLIHLIAPRSTHTGSAMLQMARYNAVFLDGLFDGGSDAPVFEYELIYYPTTTTGGPEGLKIPNPDGVTGVPVAGRGADKELYRWHFLIKNSRDADDYGKLIPFLEAMGLPQGPEFHARTQQLLDVDQWLRAFAVQSLWGIGDNYVSGAQHNAMFYTRPTDGKTMLLPWDMDFTATSSATSSLVRNGELSKLLTLPANLRAYYGHVYDIVGTAFNSTYMDPWINHYDSLLPAESFGTFRNYVATRSAYALNVVNSTVPATDFNITTNNGNPFTSNDIGVTLQGKGWINVREIRLAGS
ncbi:MAG: CotH kinase family protein, partial [Candidatus Nealsonbacteria bacterium]|nr:CotH kinase family protein [Candidatus Nealsonbacteria bacterium]